MTGLAVGVMVLSREGKILLGWYDANERKSWGFPGGEVELGEDIFTAARRKLEELGIEGQSFEIISVSRDRPRTGRWVTLGILCQKYRGRPPAGWEWFSLELLPKALLSPAQKIIKNYKLGQLYGA